MGTSEPQNRLVKTPKPHKKAIIGGAKQSMQHAGGAQMSSFSSSTKNQMVPTKTPGTRNHPQINQVHLDNLPMYGSLVGAPQTLSASNKLRRTSRNHRQIIGSN